MIKLFYYYQMNSKTDDNLIKVTCILSFLISALYVWRGLSEGFHVVTWVIISANLIYIPIVLFLLQKGFIVFYTLYAVLVIFIGALYNAKLYNNFTGAFIMLNVIMLNVKAKKALITIYLTAVTIAFAVNDESLNHYLIHIVRATWFYVNMERTLKSFYARKRLELTADEITILEELREKGQLKACTSFSKNVLTDKLKQARTRNGVINNQELLALYNLNQ